MYFLTGLTGLIFSTSFVISSVEASFFQKSISVAPEIIETQRTPLPNSRRAGVSIAVKLLPYEILAGEATSYADVSLTLSNALQRNIEVEVTQIEIVADGTQRVLMAATPQELKRPTRISLKPGESRVLEYRLRSESKIYQRGQDAIARIRYRQNNQTEQIVRSHPEAVAFTIP